MARRPARRRIAIDFMTDLAASVVVVLVCGWLFQVSVNDVHLHNAMVGQDKVLVAIDRFIPQNLFASYVRTIGQAVGGVGSEIDIAAGYGTATGQALSWAGRFAAAVILAAPRTMLELYRETDGLAAGIVLGGFVVALCGVFLWLVTAGRLILFRIVLASVLSPLAVSLVFLLLQVFMVAMLDAFFWFTVLAPYTVACPVVCTLYWVLFPSADRGMTHTLLRTIGDALLSRRS
jgi:hypothetical protein